MSEEIWKDIEGYEGKYSVNKFGYVMSHNYHRENRSKILAFDKNGNYDIVTLCKNGKCKRMSVHRIVAKGFLKNKDNKPQVNHIDGNPANNFYKNLEWCTASENIKHAIDTGLIIPRSGKKHHSIKEIKMIDKHSNEVLKTFISTVEAAKYVKGNRFAISNCARGLHKTSCGYKWEYTI